MTYLQLLGLFADESLSSSKDTNWPRYGQENELYRYPKAQTEI
jgi:hypothetical protein